MYDPGKRLPAFAILDPPASQISRPTSVLDLLLFRAKFDTDLPAISDSFGAVLSYGEWEASAAALRDALRGKGIRSDEHVGLIFDRRDWIEFAISYFGVMRAGAVPVPIENHPDRIRSRIAYAQVSACIAGSHVSYSDESWSNVRSLLSPGARATPDSRLGADSILDIVYTSGTVGGEYKAVRCRHSDWLSMNALRPVRRQRTCVHALFQPHSSAGVHGLLIGHLERGVHSVAAAGAKLYDDGEEARQFAVAVRVHSAYEVMLTPRLADTLLELDLIDAPSFSSVRYAKVGGSPLPADIGRRLTQLLSNMRIVSLYGTTESAKALLATFWEPNNVDVLGTTEGSTAVRVVDAEGKGARIGEIGEILVEASQGSGRLEYFADPANSAVVFQDGWVRTGDLGYVDNDKRVRLAGRIKEMLILPSGQKINSFRLERNLREIGDIKDVSVIGLPQPDKPYDLVAVAVVPTAGAAAGPMISAMRRGLEAELAPAKVVIVDRLPLNAMGKVARPEVVRLFAECAVGVHDLRSERQRPGTG